MLVRLLASVGHLHGLCSYLGGRGHQVVGWGCARFGPDCRAHCGVRLVNVVDISASLSVRAEQVCSASVDATVTDILRRDK